VRRPDDVAGAAGAAGVNKASHQQTCPHWVRKKFNYLETVLKKNASTTMLIN